MPVWTIIGEVGAALDATPRTLATIGARNARLSLQSLAADVLSWSTPTGDPAGAALVLPDLGQDVSLVKDGTTTVFRGTVSKRRPIYRGGLLHYEIEVQGPWWWLERLQLSSSIADDTGDLAERLSFAFAAGGLAGMIEDLLDAAAAAGAPVAFGSCAIAYDLPEVTLQDMSYLAALAELLRFLPDSIARWDYSADPAELVVTRRGSASTVSLALGTDPIEELDLAPELRLEPDETVVLYAERLATGAKAYNFHSSEKVRASLTTAMTGTNNDLTVTARKPGTGGNSITLAIDSTTSHEDLEVRRVGSAITVFRSSGTITAAEVVDAINSATETSATDQKGIWTTSESTTKFVKITAKQPGEGGNGIEVVFNNTGTSDPVITVSGRTITVTGTTLVTANEVIDGINNDYAASLLVTAEAVGGPFTTEQRPRTTITTANGNAGAAALVVAAIKSGEDGSGAVTALTATALSGGSDGTAAAAGKRSLVLVSGDELDTFLPPKEFEYVKVRTGALTDFQLFKDFDSRIRQLIADYGDFDLTEYDALFGAGVGWVGVIPTTRAYDGVSPVGVSNYLRTPDRLPDWAWLDSGHTFQRVVREGTYYANFGIGWTYSGGTAQEQAIYDQADAIRVIPSGTWQGTYAIYVLSLEVIGSGTSWPATRPLYRPAGWEFAQPPADLATNLQAAQAWVPYVGTLSLRGAELDPASYLGRVLNISGGPAEWATAKALLTGIDLDLGRRRATLRAGAPARVDAATLARRLRRNPADNLRYL